MAEQDFVEFMVMEVGLPEVRGLGSHRFRVAPRVDDFITMDRDGQGEAFEVVAVIHPLEPASTAGDILIRHIGNGTSAISRFKEPAG